MVCPINKLIVTLEKRFANEVELSNGMRLFQDTFFRPEHHVTTTGMVVSVPLMLSDKRDNDGLTIDVKPGDELIFNYQVVFDVDENNNHTNIFWVDGKDYWMVDYSQAFAVKREGRIIPINGNAIISELEAVQKETFEGTELLLPDSMKQKIRKGAGIVKYLGNPLIGDKPIEAKCGDIVYYRPEIAEIYEMYGELVVIMKQKYLLAYKEAV